MTGTPNKPNTPPPSACREEECYRKDEHYHTRSGKVFPNTPPVPGNTTEVLEEKLASDLRHTLKLVPSSQRELFVFELARYLAHQQAQLPPMPDTTNTAGCVEELQEGYDFEDFKESYRKYHDGREAPIAFIVDLIAMQAAVLAEVATHTDRQVETECIKARQRAETHHLSNLARAVGILEGLGHYDSYLRGKYDEMLAQLNSTSTPSEKEK